VYVSIEADTKEHAEWISRAVVRVLQEKGLGYWGRAATAGLNVVPLDLPLESSRVGGVVGLALDLAIRTLLALLLAVGIAFLRHYLDRSVRQRGDIEALGLDVIGTIPFTKGAKS
jgi:capsular polysaccharide biosynthesis protein